MHKRNAGLCIALILGVFVLNGCKKFDKQGFLPQAGIAMTFDDNYVDNWIKYLPFLDSSGIKATFYISNYNRLNARQIQDLHIIQNHGHEIAYHTVNHYNMVDYVYKYRHSVEDLMQKEIVAGLKMMNKDGFYPTTFAFPGGTHCDAIDESLKHYFKSVRALNGTFNYAKSLAATDNNYMLYGFSLDKSSKQKDVTVEHLLESAKSNNTCAVLLTHIINVPSSQLSTSLDRLKKVVATAKRLDLKFYTISEISKK